MAATIKDIAKVAGVSYSTVSRALNNKECVKEDKRRRIIEIANEMGYVPNQAALNLKFSKAHTIGLFFSFIGKESSPYVLHNVLSGVYTTAYSNYNVMVKGINLQLPNTLDSTMYDGIIVLSQRDEDKVIIEEAIDKNIPIVVLNRPVEYEVPHVLTDEKMGMKLGMEHLLENGHTKIGVIEASSKLASSRSRHKGWVEAVTKYGIDPKSIPVEVGNYRFKSGYESAKKLLEKDLTAILCFSDDMAYGARKAILEKGLLVPEDISLVGYDNMYSFEYLDLQLTTVERNMEKIASKGTEILIDMIENETESKDTIYLENKLIVRESVKKIL